MPQFAVQPATEDDLPGILLLQDHAEADEPAAPQAFAQAWRWLNLHNPAAIQRVLVGIDPQQRVVAHQSMVPFGYRLGGQAAIGGFLCQLVIAKDFRKTLLLVNLESRMLRDYTQSGLSFAYTAVRPWILKVHLALGFRHLGTLPVYARPYRLLGLADHYLGRGLWSWLARPALWAAQSMLRCSWQRKPKHLEVTQVPRFEPQIDPFLTEVCRHFPTHAQRNVAILNWRFQQLPERQYQIFLAGEGAKTVGYAVLRRMRMMGFEVLAIVDLLFSPQRPDVGKALLAAVHEVAVRSEVDLAVCLLNPHSPFLPCLRKSGYLKTPQGFCLIVHEPKQAAARFDEDVFRQWHLSWFDHDYV